MLYTNIYRFRIVLKTRSVFVLFFKHTLFLVLILLLQSYQPYLVQAVCLVALVQIQYMFQLTLGFFVLVSFVYSFIKKTIIDLYTVFLYTYSTMDCNKFEDILKECMSKLSKQRFVDTIHQCTYTQSPERNRLQNCFLDTEFQKLVVKKSVNVENCLSSPDIEHFYRTEFYQKCMKRFTLDNKIEIAFSPGTFWDVVITQEYTGFVMECSFTDMEVVDYHAQRLKETLNSATIDIFTRCNKPTIGFRLHDKIKQVLCLIRPTLGDEYPSVLRAMNIKVEEDEDKYEDIGGVVLLVEYFSAIYTLKEQLKQIFKHSKITVLFYND